MLVVLALLQASPSLPIERTGVFASPHLRESSGVAVSRTHPGVLWTHNDSGDGPYLYATTLAGDDRGRLRLPDATAVDWEDMAAGPCPDRDGACLYLADTGDNLERRAAVTIYAVAEPTPPTGPADTTGVTAPPRELRVRYPDQPHDVEAVFVTPTGALFLVTKGRTPPVRVFRVPRSAWASAGVVTAELVQTLDVGNPSRRRRQVTAAAVTPDGARVAIRTYVEVLFFTWRRDGTLRPAGACELGALEPQGEALDFLDAGTLVLTSEAAASPAGPIHRVRCPVDSQPERNP
jgi:hypothetical protein